MLFSNVTVIYLSELQPLTGDKSKAEVHEPDVWRQ